MERPRLASQFFLGGCCCPAEGRISVIAWRFSRRLRVRHIRWGMRAVAAGAAAELAPIMARAAMIGSYAAREEAAGRGAGYRGGVGRGCDLDRRGDDGLSLVPAAVPPGASSVAVVGLLAAALTTGRAAAGHPGGHAAASARRTAEYLLPRGPARDLDPGRGAGAEGVLAAGGP